MQYNRLSEHARYHTDPLREVTDKMVVVQRGVRFAKQAPRYFKCYVIDSPKQLSTFTNAKLQMVCVFKRGVGTLRTNAGDLIGLIQKKDDAHIFTVNGKTIAKLAIYTSSRADYDTYKLNVDEVSYNMARPRRDNDQYRISYNIIKGGSIFGIPSHKNFRMNDSNDRSILECVKCGGKQLLLSGKHPFNIFVAAALGIMRYRERVGVTSHS